MYQLKSNPEPDSFKDFSNFSLKISLEEYSGKSIRLKLNINKTDTMHEPS